MGNQFSSKTSVSAVPAVQAAAQHEPAAAAPKASAPAAQEVTPDFRPHVILLPEGLGVIAAAAPPHPVTQSSFSEGGPPPVLPSSTECEEGTLCPVMILIV